MRHVALVPIALLGLIGSARADAPAGRPVRTQHEVRSCVTTFLDGTQQTRCTVRRWITEGDVSTPAAPPLPAPNAAPSPSRPEQIAPASPAEPTLEGAPELEPEAEVPDAELPDFDGEMSVEPAAPAPPAAQAPLPAAPPAEKTDGPATPAAPATTAEVPTPSTDEQPLATEAEVLTLLNQERGRRGLGQLRLDPQAVAAARAHSRDMCTRSYFSHVSPDGKQPWDRLREAGARFDAAAENIAAGYTSASAVHQGWMQSDGHRANRLNAAYTRAGVGAHLCRGSVVFWTELFMR